MGSGKSTIGRQLALKLNKIFIDSDSEIVKRTGVDIELIFDIEGEEGFRKRESKLIEEVTQLEGIVLASGGGTILLASNRDCLKRGDIVIYLKASAQQLYKRTAGDKKRPLLQTDDRLGKIKDILEQRETLYEEVADKIITTGNLTINKIVNNICQNL